MHNFVHILPRIDLFCMFCSAPINNYSDQACVLVGDRVLPYFLSTMCQDHWLLYCTQKAWDPELSLCVNQICDTMQIDATFRLLMGPNEVYQFTGLNGYHYTNVSEKRRHEIHRLYSLYKPQPPMVYMGPVETYLADENESEIGGQHITDAELVTSDAIEAEILES